MAVAIAAPADSLFIDSQPNMENRSSSSSSVQPVREGWFLSNAHQPFVCLSWTETRVGYSHYSTDRKCRSTSYDYQNGGSYFDSSHNASFVRGAPAFCLLRSGENLNRQKAADNTPVPSFMIFNMIERKRRTRQLQQLSSQLRQTRCFPADVVISFKNICNKWSHIYLTSQIITIN